MQFYSVVVPFLLSAVLGWLFIPRVLILSHRKRLFDMPDERKMHNLPIPRLGGITFLPILLLCVCIVLGLWVTLNMPYAYCSLHVLLVRFILLFVGMMMLFLVGVVDDLIGVSYQAKFMVQIVCAVFFPISGLWIHDLTGLFWLGEIPAWVGIPLTVFVVVYVTNAINLIDGVDGLAAGICFVALLTLGLAAMMRAQYLFMVVTFGMLGILLPFWLFNVYGNVQRGNKIFMGDTGSLTLGYLVSFLLIYMAGEADKNHIHHKILRTGIGPRLTMLILILASLTMVLITIWAVWVRISTTWIFFIDVGFWLAFDYTVNYFIYRNHRQRYE